jgi:hypothetical protein
MCKRTIVFLQMGSISFVASIVASPLAGAVMLSFGSWVGCILALSFVGLSWLLSLFIPDTLRMAAAGKAMQGGVDSEDDRPPASEGPHGSVSSPVQRVIERVCNTLVEARHFLSSHQFVVILTMCFLFEVLAGLAGMLLLQYVTKKFNWSWGKVICPFSFP